MCNYLLYSNYNVIAQGIHTNQATTHTLFCTRMVIQLTFGMLPEVSSRKAELRATCRCALFISWVASNPAG